MAAIDKFWLVVMPLAFLGFMTATLGFDSVLIFIMGLGLIPLLLGFF